MVARNAHWARVSTAYNTQRQEDRKAFLHILRQYWHCLSFSTQLLRHISAHYRYHKILSKVPCGNIDVLEWIKCLVCIRLQMMSALVTCLLYLKYLCHDVASVFASKWYRFRLCGLFSEHWDHISCLKRSTYCLPAWRSIRFWCTYCIRIIVIFHRLFLPHQQTLLLNMSGSSFLIELFDPDRWPMILLLLDIWGIKPLTLFLDSSALLHMARAKYCLFLKNYSGRSGGGIFE